MSIRLTIASANELILKLQFIIILFGFTSHLVSINNYVYLFWANLGLVKLKITISLSLVKEK
jgi:hypothetical protein